MPNIKVIDPKEWNVHPSEEGAAAFERVGRYVGQAWRELGGSAQNLADNAAQNEARSQQMSMSADISKFQVEAHQNLSDFLKTADPSDPDALKKWNDSYFQPTMQKLQEKYADSSSIADMLTGNRYHDATAQHFSYSMNAAQSSLLDRATGEWSSIQGRYYVQKADETYGNYATLAHDDPSQLGSYLEQSDAFTNGLPIDAATRKQLSRAGRARISDSAADGIVALAENPANTTPKAIAAAIAQFQDPRNGFKANMSSDNKYDQVLDRLQKAGYAYAGMQSEVAAQNVPSWREAIRNGNVDAYNSLIGLSQTYQGKDARETAAKRAEFASDASEDQAAWKVMQPFTTMSDKDIQHYVEDFPNRMQGVAPENAKDMIAQRDAAVKYLKQRDTEFKADPVGYTVNHDGVTQSRAQAFMQNPNPGTWNNYATAASAYQHQIYPDRVPEIVPPQIVTQFKSELAAAQNSTQGATAAMQTIGKWADTTGNYWPQMAHELYDKHALSPAQFGSAIAYSNPQSRGLSADMLRASMTPVKELEERARSNSHTLVEYDNAVQQALTPFQKTMVIAPNGAMLGDALYQAVRNTAMMHGDPTQAQSIVDNMLGTKYAFEGSYRIPKDAGFDPDQIAAGANRVLNDLPNHKLVNPDGSAMDANERAGMAGQWITNNDESGLILYGNDASPIKERNAKGQIVPVTLKWADLSKAGA